MFGAVGESDFDFALFSVELGDGADAESLMLDLRTEDDFAVIDILGFLLCGCGSYNAVQPDICVQAAVLLCAIYSSKIGFVLLYAMPTILMSVTYNILLHFEGNLLKTKE